MIKKKLIRILDKPIKLYNQIKIKSYYKNIKLDANQLTDLGKILVLIPHVDDETIGLGGLLSGLSGSNEMNLLYGTDSGGSMGNISRSELSEIRFDEANKLADNLGVTIVDKLVDIHNGSLEWPYDYFKESLYKVLDENNYSAIFTVSHVDAHPDHQKLTYFLAKALADYDYNGDVYLYEVSNFLPNDWINTYYKMSKEEFNNKQDLYKYFDSQKTMDFDIFNKLNIYKGLAINELNPVEFFAKMSKDEFIEKVNIVRKENLEKILPYRIGNNTSFYKVINREKTVQKIYKEKGW